MIDRDKYYLASGQIGVMGIIYLIVFGILGCGAGGFIYAAATYYSPIIYLNLALTLGYGFLIGWLVVKACEIGQVRHRIFALAVGLFFGVLAVYSNRVGWATFMYFKFFSEWILVLNPSSIWSFMQLVAVEGYWSYGSGGDPVKGVTLNIVWFVEVAMILAIVLGYCWKKAAVKPFCERCRKWLSQTGYMSFLETIGQP